MLKILIRVAISVVVVVGLVYGGILLYTKVINPPEDKLNEDDLSAIVSESSTPTPDVGITKKKNIVGTGHELQKLNNLIKPQCIPLVD